MSQIQFLNDEQRRHYLKLREILECNVAYFDCSPTGTGKTEMAIKVASDLGLKLVVITELSLVSQWKNRCQRYNVPLISATYASLRGRTGIAPNSDFLEFDEPEISGNGKNKKIHYKASKTFLDLVEQGSLLIFDECHNLKNDSMQHEAAMTLVRSVISVSQGDYDIRKRPRDIDSESQLLKRQECKSRIGLLSASPASKDKNAMQYIKLLGIMTHPYYIRYDHLSKKTDTTGILQAYERAKMLDPLAAGLENSWNKTSVERWCIRWYESIFGPNYSSSMSNIERVSELLEMKNIFCQISDSDKKIMESVIQDYNEAQNLIGVEQSNKLRVASLASQNVKIEACIELARRQLIEVPKCKVILFMFYVDKMQYIVDRLSEFGAGCLRGDVPGKKRTEIVERFQQNNLDMRVLVAQQKVGGVGLNLDDVHGDFPRYVYIIPNHFFTDLYQAKGRTIRQTTKSKTYVYFVYVDGYDSEIRLLNKLVKNKNGLRKYINKNKNIILPTNTG